MALTTLVNGTLADADPVNSNFNGLRVLQIYTGTGFNASGGSGATNNVELTAITSNISDVDYVIIQGAVYGKAEQGSATLLIESKEVGDSYATDKSFTVAMNSTTGSNPDGTGGTGSIFWVHTLTSGEKANGIQFKLTGTSSGLNDGAISNVSIMFQGGQS